MVVAAVDMADSITHLPPAWWWWGTMSEFSDDVMARDRMMRPDSQPLKLPSATNSLHGIQDIYIEESNLLPDHRLMEATDPGRRFLPRGLGRDANHSPFPPATHGEGPLWRKALFFHV